MADRVGDHVQVFFQGRAEHLAHVQVPGLADDGDHRRSAASSRALRQVSSPGATPLRRVMPKAATRAWRSGSLPDLLEILEVLGVGQRIAALDEIDAQVVEPRGDAQLVLEREVDALALAAVAEGGVVDEDARHGGPEKNEP